MIQNYFWIPCFTGVVAFVMAYGIGANDVANAFATSVGAKAITIKTALVIAGIMEFSGAFFMGAHVTKTIAGDILIPSFFADRPDVLMFAFTCALMSAAIWLIIASSLKMPVSTTHSIVGSMIGCGLVAHGAEAVQWTKVWQIVASWFVSPILSGIFSWLLFFIVRTTILRNAKSYTRALAFYPVLFGLTIGFNVIFVIYKGSPSLPWKNIPFFTSALIGLGVGIVTGLLAFFFMVPFIKRSVAKKFPITEKPIAVDLKAVIATSTPSSSAAATAPATHTVAKAPQVITIVEEKSSPDHITVEEKKGMFNKDVHAELKDEKSAVYAIHQNAENFDEKTEKVFTFVQVITATFDSFCHGANDVANSIGPFAGAIAIYNAHAIPKNVEVPMSILLLGGAGIVVGLATYGYKIMAAIGVNMVKVTPSRGFCIEFGAAIVILFGSLNGLPLSTTHCQVGSTVGVGLMEGKSGINWKLFSSVFLGWVLTLVICGALAGAFFFFGAFSPGYEVPF